MPVLFPLEDDALDATLLELDSTLLELDTTLELLLDEALITLLDDELLTELELDDEGVPAESP